MKISVSALLLVMLIMVSGCVSNQNGAVMPGADIASIKKYYVVHLPADSRGVNKLIADNLVARGYEATTGEAVNVPADTQALVTYQDKWMWDITMYMLKLDVQFRKPQNDMPLATGTSTRTSLVRKSSEEMVKEVLDQIFAKVQPATTPAMSNK
jgi:hypothetical protein